MKIKALIVLLLLASPVVAQTQLENLSRVSVSIEEMPPVLSEAGYSRTELKAMLEKRLAIAGIKVDDRAVGIPTVYLNLNAIEGDGFYAAVVTLKLNEPVYPHRDSARAVIGSTWHKETLSLLDDLKDVRARINKLLDAFIGEYSKANPTVQQRRN